LKFELKLYIMLLFFCRDFPTPWIPYFVLFVYRLLQVAGHTEVRDNWLFSHNSSLH
jgi:hypothetical protein